MKEKGCEELSALMDGEASEFELHRMLRGMESDSALARKWERYHLASALLKKQTRPCDSKSLLQMNLADRVAGVLANEPVLNIAQPSAGGLAAVAKSGWLRTTANVAIAASVAAVVVLTWQNTQAPDAKPVAAAALAQTTLARPSALVGNNALFGAPVSVMPASQGGAVPVAQSFGVMPRVQNMQSEIIRNKSLNEDRFNHYLISHSGNAAFSTQGGPVPYVRVVTLKPSTETR